MKVNYEEVVKDFTELVENIKRPGINDLVEFLKKTDFFLAPASTRFHGSRRSGLVQHSTKVCKILVDLTEKNNLVWGQPDSVYIVALFHDLCKLAFYGESLRNVKKASGWVKEPYYVVDDQLPIGAHGDKSVFIAMKYMRLTNEEIACIRFHMGYSEPKDGYMALNNAMRKYPNVSWLFMADSLEALEDDRLTEIEAKAEALALQNQ